MEDESQLQWPCYECSKRFRTSAELQKHLSVHDDDERDLMTWAADARNDPDCVMPGNPRRSCRRKRQAAAVDDETTSATGHNDDAEVCEI